MPDKEENVTMNVNDNANDNTNDNASDTNSKEVLTLNVNVNLLQNIRSVLEISTQRGTYRANELSSVGKVYDELVTLLK
tara:strand:+ start:131 stop:367 length:237 start_codon:yes stop_codon:yes gene_type:complete